MIIDISWPISSQIVTYKDKADVKIESTRNFGEHASRESKISLGVHTGTHVDAPAHFLQNGTTIDQIDLGQLIGACTVYDLTQVKAKITKADLEKLDFTNVQIALFKTQNSFDPNTGLFNPNFVYLDLEAAQFLTTKKLTAIGIDSLGIERDQPQHQTHVILFSANIIIIEGLRLAHVNSGKYQLICLPLLLVGLDGSPARVVLVA